jgi:hypothetical protein
MKAQQTFSILFWVSKNRLKSGRAPLSIRITVDGKRVELSAQREVSLLEWDARAQLVTGRSQEAKEINNHLAILKARLLNCHGKLEARGVTITAETLKNEFTVLSKNPGCCCR